MWMVTVLLNYLLIAVDTPIQLGLEHIMDALKLLERSYGPVPQVEPNLLQVPGQTLNKTQMIVAKMDFPAPPTVKPNDGPKVIFV